MTEQIIYNIFTQWKIILSLKVHKWIFVIYCKVKENDRKKNETYHLVLFLQCMYWDYVHKSLALH